MASEPKEFTRPSRTGRMTGVNVTIDGETWQYVLNHAGIPINTPLSQIKIRRYATKGKRIILKIIVEPATMPETPIINESASVKANIPHTNKTPQMPPNNDNVFETPMFPSTVCYECGIEYKARMLPFREMNNFGDGKTYICDSCYKMG